MTETVRIDKWLWAARFFKTRSLAADAVESGKVRWNDERTKPSRNLKTGDILHIDNGAMQWQVTVCILSDKRGAAAIAQTLYQEMPESIIRRQNDAEQRKLFHEPTSHLKGRPTKRDRRLLDQSRS
jgi:ribosome-associated heat shock protein Hsp15